MRHKRLCNFWVLSWNLYTQINHLSLICSIVSFEKRIITLFDAMNDGREEQWRLFRLRAVLSLKFELRKRMNHVDLKATSKEEAVSRATVRWAERVRVVYRPCCLCVSSGTCYVMVCVLESSDYFSSVGSPKEVSSQDVAFSKCLRKRKEGGQRKWELSVGCWQETHFTKMFLLEWQLN